MLVDLSCFTGSNKRGVEETRVFSIYGDSHHFHCSLKDIKRLPRAKRKLCQQREDTTGYTLRHVGYFRCMYTVCCAVDVQKYTRAFFWGSGGTNTDALTTHNPDFNYASCRTTLLDSLNDLFRVAECSRRVCVISGKCYGEQDKWKLRIKLGCNR